MPELIWWTYSEKIILTGRKLGKFLFLHLSSQSVFLFFGKWFVNMGLRMLGSPFKKNRRQRHCLSWTEELFSCLVFGCHQHKQELKQYCPETTLKCLITGTQIYIIYKNLALGRDRPHSFECKDMIHILKFFMHKKISSPDSVMCEVFSELVTSYLLVMLMSSSMSKQQNIKSP